MVYSPRMGFLGPLQYAEDALVTKYPKASRTGHVSHTIPILYQHRALSCGVGDVFFPPDNMVVNILGSFEYHAVILKT